jgi:hypothetical protein
MRRIVFGVWLIALLMATASCGGGDSTGPAAIPPSAINGLYIAATPAFDIRLHVEYREDDSMCDTLPSVADRILCSLAAPNLHGTGSITLRGTGEIQTFQLSGLQFIGVVMLFNQPAGVMVDTKLNGTASDDGATLSGMIGPKNGAATSAIFRDSTAVTFVRSPGS